MNTENKSNTPLEIKDSWQTPIEIFRHLNAEFEFTLDVASSKDNTLCSVYIDEAEDALSSVEWCRTNWCNPPYSNIGPWVDKAIEQYKLGNTTVMLVPSDTSVKWFRKAFISCNEVRFISGRISFISAGTGLAVSGNNKGSVLLIWRGLSPKGSRSVSLIDRSDFKTT